MDRFDAEAKVHDYIVYSYLLKALDKDREQLCRTKLARAWTFVADDALAKIVKRLTFIKNQLSNHGCRIVLEEVAPDHQVHVMYVQRRYERHCYMLPYVLKARCEDAMISLLRDESGSCQ